MIDRFEDLRPRRRVGLDERAAGGGLRVGLLDNNSALFAAGLIDGDRVICCPGGPETAIAALDKRTGLIVWKSPPTGDAAGYSSAANRSRSCRRRISCAMIQR